MMLRDGLIHLIMIKKIPLPVGKYKKVPGLFKDELGGKIIKEFVALRAEAYSYLYDDGNEYTKSKGTKRCVIKQKFMFLNLKDCLLNNKTVYRSQERFKCYNHDVYTEEVNKIALVTIMTKKYKHLMELKHTHREEMLLKYINVKC